jgi:hypothetical protein
MKMSKACLTLACPLLLVSLVIVVLSGSSLAVTNKVLVSTVPANGDVNPYGVAVVPTTTGALTQGNILISNFNNSSNAQGTGSTIVQITPWGTASLFAQINASSLPGPCPGGIGLTTALVALKSGYVIVGSLPTSDGTSATMQAGCLLVLNSSGKVVETFYGSLINGPWDMTASDGGTYAVLFVTNVLNGTVAANGKIVNHGSVVRLNLNIPSGSWPALESITTIASGFSQRTDPAALVIGPTGVAIGYVPGISGTANAVLYVADSLNNRIVSIPQPFTREVSAGTGTVVSSGGWLNDPLGLAVGGGGNIIALNGNNGYEVVITPSGKQISKFLLDDSGSPPGAGALFGLAIVGEQIYYVDDATNTFNLYN